MDIRWRQGVFLRQLLHPLPPPPSIFSAEDPALSWCGPWQRVELSVHVNLSVDVGREVCLLMTCLRGILIVFLTNMVQANIDLQTIQIPITVQPVDTPVTQIHWNHAETLILCAFLCYKGIS